MASSGNIIVSRHEIFYSASWDPSLVKYRSTDDHCCPVKNGRNHVTSRKSVCEVYHTLFSSSIFPAGCGGRSPVHLGRGERGARGALLSAAPPRLEALRDHLLVARFGRLVIL